MKNLSIICFVMLLQACTTSSHKQHEAPHAELTELLGDSLMQSIKSDLKEALTDLQKARHDSIWSLYKHQVDEFGYLPFAESPYRLTFDGYTFEPADTALQWYVFDTLNGSLALQPCPIQLDSFRDIENELLYMAMPDYPKHFQFAKHTPFFALSGFSNDTPSLSNVQFDNKDFLYPGQQLDFSMNGKSYTIAAYGYDRSIEEDELEHKSYQNYFLTISDGQHTQLMAYEQLASVWGDIMGLAKVLWIGDIDQDQQPDVILYFQGEMMSNAILLVSSAAQNQDITVAVDGCFSGIGC